MAQVQETIANQIRCKKINIGLEIIDFFKTNDNDYIYINIIVIWGILISSEP